MNWIVLEAGDIQKEWDALLQNALLQTCAGEKILLPNLEMLVNKSNILCKEIDHTTTALHVACRKNNLQAVRVLLDAGTSVNSRDECGATALHQMSSLFSHNKITSMYSFFLLIFRLKDLTTGIKCDVFLLLMKTAEDCNENLWFRNERPLAKDGYFLYF